MPNLGPLTRRLGSISGTAPLLRGDAGTMVTLESAGLELATPA
jgi:hypothetical protein